MNRRSFIIPAILLLVLTSIKANAQTDAVYSQSLFNTQLANPAYAGSWSGTGYMMNIRRQWIGMEGAPSTQSLTFQQQHFRQNAGWGLHILNDRLGKERKVSLLGDYSYRIETNWRSWLYFGLRFGITGYRNNLDLYNTYDPNYDFDPAFQGMVERYLIPNFGIGFLLQSDDYQIGFSVPRLIQLEYSSDVSRLNTYSELRHYLLSGSKVYRLSYHVFIKPSIRLMLVRGAPLEINPSLDVLLYPKFWIGGFYRYNESAGATLQWVFSRNMRFGYIFEFPANRFSRQQFGTHEVMFSYEVNFTRNNRYNFRFY